LILPLSTLAPEAIILFYSSGSYGLWSLESYKIFPFLLKADLESPVLATAIVFYAITTTLAVAPTESATFPYANGCIPLFKLICLNYYSPYLVSILSSNFWKVYLKAA